MAELKTKDILEDLPLARLRQLCAQRKLTVGGNKADLLERLARSYRGIVDALVDQLSRAELINALGTIRFFHDGHVGSLTYLGQATKEQLQHVGRLVFGDWSAESLDATPATSDSSIGIRWTKPEAPADGREAVLSTQWGAAGFRELSVASLRAEIEGARSLSIASAYYDVRFFLELLKSKHLPDTLRQIRIITNGLAGARLNAQIEELMGVKKQLAARFAEIEIRLVFSRGIFHTKLILIRRRKSRVALIGSANATLAAMTDNEEILLRVVEDTAPLEAYFDHVWTQHSEDLGAREGRARTLVNFFRSGRLYFKSSTALQLTVNPFAELLRALPVAERRKLTNVHLRHSEAKAGVGPFDLKAALGLSEDKQSAEGTNDTKSGRASIKPFSVETCFGYWVPAVLTEELAAKLDAAGASKRERIRDLEAALAVTDDSMLTAKYEEYIVDARVIFDDRVIPIGEHLESLPFNPFDSSGSREWFQSRLVRLRKNFSNEKYVAHLCRPYSDAVMPEIWGDPVAYDEFRNSFFEYISYVSTLPTGRRVPSAVLGKLGFEGPVGAEDLQEQLENYLQHTGWHDREDWGLGTPEEM